MQCTGSFYAEQYLENNVQYASNYCTICLGKTLMKNMYLMYRFWQDICLVHWGLMLPCL